MGKNGQTSKRYSEEFKLCTVEMYEKGGMVYRAIAKELGIPSKTQVLQWVRKKNSGQGFVDQRGKNCSSDTPFVGRPRTKFATVEEERDVQKATLHSDQGFQYTSRQYNKRIKELGISGSHSPMETALITPGSNPFSRISKLRHCTLYIWFYRHERFQKKLNQLCPGRIPKHTDYLPIPACN